MKHSSLWLCGKQHSVYSFVRRIRVQWEIPLSTVSIALDSKTSNVPCFYLYILSVYQVSSRYTSAVPL